MATTITVKNSTELYAALAKATGGETILLAGGEYGGLSMSQYSTVKGQFASTVTIKSADPDNPAEFSSMNLRDVSNLTIDGVVFDYTFRATDSIDYKPFTVSSSSNIVVKNSVFDGDIASGLSTAANGYGYAQGLFIRWSSNVVVENNEFFDWHRGAVFSEVSNLTVTNNDIHSIRSDGFDFVAIKTAKIEGNYFHDFEASPNSGDHRDMIQFWTTGTSTPSTNIVIRSNTFDIGEGNYTQSIFMRNEKVDTGQAGTSMYYQNVLIENNTIYNAHLHGITVGETNGLTIRNNSLIAVPSTLGETNGLATWVPVINVKSTSTGVSITDNLVGAINGAGSSAIVSGNVLIQNRDPFKANYYSDVFVDSSMTAVNGQNGFIIKPGTVADTKNTGASSTQYDTTPTNLTAFFETATSETNAKKVTFDASLTVDKLAGIKDTGQFLWDFGDGTTARGLVVAHTYKDAGKYEATLTVISANGTKDVAEIPVRINSADMLSFNEKTGQFVSHSFGETTTLGGIGTKAVATSLGVGLNLGGTGVQASSAGVSRLSDADSFDLALKLRSDSNGSEWGEVFRVHGTLLGSINSDGNFNLRLTTEGGTVNKLTTTGVKLNDGKIHDVKISFDGDAGSLKIIVDGIVVASKVVYGDVQQTGGRPLDFGNAWGKKNFEGVLLDLDFDVNRSQYPAVGTPTTEVLKVNGGGTAVPEPQPLPSEPAPLPAPPIVDTDSEEQTDGTEAPLTDGFKLDMAKVAASPATYLKDGALLVAEGGDQLLRLDGTNDWINVGRLGSFEKSEQLAFEIDYSRDVADGSPDRLVWNHMKMGLTVAGDGLFVHVATKDQGLKAFSVGNLGLNDTETHNIKVLIDQDEDRLQVIVDDKVVLNNTSTDFEFVGAGGREWGWYLGGPWKHFFDGDITDFHVTNDFIFQDEVLPQDSGLLT